MKHAFVAWNSPDATGRQPPVLAILWGTYGPYHFDRCQATSREFADEMAVVGLEMASHHGDYSWAPLEGSLPDVNKVTLFPGKTYEETSRSGRFVAALRACKRLHVRALLLCHVTEPEYLLLALVMRVRGCQVYAMTDSKFDDKRRNLFKEVLKSVAYAPYNGVFVGGIRSEEYMRFLGVRAGRIQQGYDTVSVGRLREQAGELADGQPPTYQQRHFTVVARFVAKKNIHTAIEAYRLYRTDSGPEARALVICGDGPLEENLRKLAEGIEGIEFRGFLQAAGIAQTLARSLALVLPSIEEQWGLVVNEALSLGVPVLVSHNVGARDTLVRTAVNGHTFEPDNVIGLSRLMAQVGSDEAEWRRLSQGASEWAIRGDSAEFAKGVRRLISGS